MLDKIEKPVGTIKFDNKLLNVYVSVNEPIFRATDIASMIGYSEGNTWKLLELCEHDEKLMLPMIVGKQIRHISFVTLSGLINILSQCRKPIAKEMRNIIIDGIIRNRKDRGLNIIEQFDEWKERI